MIRRFNLYLQGLSATQYALRGGVVALVSDAATSAAVGRGAGPALGKAVVVALGAAVACDFLARRFARTR